MGDVDAGIAALPSGLATAVGPVPFDDVAAAVDFAVRANPGFPTVPVLEPTDRSLLAQAVAGVPGVTVAGPGRLEVDPVLLADGAEAPVQDLGGEVFGTLHALVGELAEAPDVPVRVAVLGPVTLALALAAAAVPLDRALRLAGDLVRRRAAAVLDAVRAERPDATTVVVLVEPGLTGAMHPTFPLTPRQVRSLLDPVVAELDAGAPRGSLLIGVHVPGRTDWGTVLDTGVSLVSAPAEESLAGWSDRLATLLEAGGRIAWGAVPVDRPLGTGEQRLWRRLSEVWGHLSAAGVDPVLVRERSLVSPADGLAHFGPSQAERVMGLTGSLASRAHRQAVSARLPLGA